MTVLRAVVASVVLAGALAVGAVAAPAIPVAAAASGGVSGAPAFVAVGASATGLIPGIGAVTSLIGGVASELAGQVASIASSLLDEIGRGIADAVSGLLQEVSTFLTASTRPDVTASSFVGPDGAYHKVAQVSAVLMVLFLFFAVLQGLLAGEAGQMVARVAVDAPLAVLAMFGLPWVVAQLLTLVDQVCAWILPTGPTISTIARVFAADQVHAVLGTFSIPAILCELFVFLGGVGMYAELVVRSALISIVVALAPLSFAAMVWPAVRGAARKVAELLGAIILSKLAIWVALAVGTSLFSTQAQQAVPGAQAWGQMISGAAILAVALFAPFVVWRLLPVAEAALVAQGLSRQPGRAATQTLYLSNSLSRFGRGGGAAPGGVGGPSGDPTAPPGESELPVSSLDPVGPTGAGGASGAAGEGGAAAGAGGAAVVAAPVAVAVAAGTAARDRVISAAEAQAGQIPPASAPGEWSFRATDDEERR